MQTMRNTERSADARRTLRIAALPRFRAPTTSSPWRVGKAPNSARWRSGRWSPSHRRTAGSRSTARTVWLTPKQALAISMTLHELATNATKYGALSNDAGRVTINWKANREPHPAFQLRWQEHGGPTVAPPTRGGFGTRLIERGFSAETAGRTDLAYEPEGVVCVLWRSSNSVCVRPCPSARSASDPHRTGAPPCPTIAFAFSPRKILADDWARLTKYTLDFTRRDGVVERQIRQVYDRGDGAVILPVDPERQTVLLDPPVPHPGLSRRSPGHADRGLRRAARRERSRDRHPQGGRGGARLPDEGDQS